MITINTPDIKFSTKSLVSFVLALGSLMTIPAVNDAVVKVAVLHPFVSSWVVALTTIVALLHNPQVDAILGIQTEDTSTVTAQTPGGTVVQQSATHTATVVPIPTPPEV